ncbi:putative protein lysine methyltransferase SET5 [Cryptococcus depauperatus CBS 7841]|uniref:Uncharacterized protein n=1 Tax=Cryptococcus depauperatus CBS 7841 TaxID=1295531 RepID=A0AAJ8JQY5_9TREE
MTFFFPLLPVSKQTILIRVSSSYSLSSNLNILDGPFLRNGLKTLFQTQLPQSNYDTSNVGKPRDLVADTGLDHSVDISTFASHVQVKMLDMSGKKSWIVTADVYLTFECYMVDSESSQILCCTHRRLSTDPSTASYTSRRSCL